MAVSTLSGAPHLSSRTWFARSASHGHEHEHEHYTALTMIISILTNFQGFIHTQNPGTQEPIQHDDKVIFHIKKIKNLFRYRSLATRVVSCLLPVSSRREIPSSYTYIDLLHTDRYRRITDMPAVRGSTIVFSARNCIMARVMRSIVHSAST